MPPSTGRRPALSIWPPVLCCAALLALTAAHANAQGFEGVGTRASGMAGAFVAVADDASAAWWNPAGLASGAYVNIIFDKGKVSAPAGDPAAGRVASRDSLSSFSAAFPALGVSYYRLQLSQIAPISPTASNDASRQDAEGNLQIRTMPLSQFGVTLGQSLGDHFVVGSTVKLVRSGAVSAALPESGNALDAADDLEAGTNGRVDLDVGGMATFGKARFGVTVRNLTQPQFGEGDDAFSLDRQARAGMALLFEGQGAVQALTVAADADLTTTSTLFGDRRRVAAGAEVWLGGRRFGVRGGVSSNRAGDSATSFSTGVSVAPLKGVYLEASRTEGKDDTLRGWTTSFRLTF